VFERYPDARQARLRRARVGDADAGGRLDPCRRWPGGDRPPGPLSGHAHGHAQAPDGVPRRRRRCDRDPLAFTHAGAVSGIRRARTRAGTCVARAAATGMARAKATWTWATSPTCPRASSPVWKDW
jgi:hypothetical protein